VVVTPLDRANTLTGETTGVEVAVTWQVAEAWRLHGAGTVLKMFLHRAPGLAASAEAIEGQSPGRQVSLQSSWDLPRRVQCDVIGRWVSGLHGFNPGAAPGVSDTVAAYASLDVRLAWRPQPDLELSLVGQNLLDPHHPEFGTSALVRSPLVEIERRVYGKLTWRF
jgi:iron complex outermembrane receptor protein